MNRPRPRNTDTDTHAHPQFSSTVNVTDIWKISRINYVITESLDMVQNAWQEITGMNNSWNYAMLLLIACFTNFIMVPVIYSVNKLIKCEKRQDLCKVFWFYFFKINMIEDGLHPLKLSDSSKVNFI